MSTYPDVCNLSMLSMKIDRQNSIRISNKMYHFAFDKRSFAAASTDIKYHEVTNFDRSTIGDASICVMCGGVHDVDCIIPKQNKNVCKGCDSSFWMNVKLELIMKFCKGCKNFLCINEFDEKPDSSKCGKCRERGRLNYFARKLENQIYEPSREKFEKSSTDDSESRSFTSSKYNTHQRSNSTSHFLQYEEATSPISISNMQDELEPLRIANSLSGSPISTDSISYESYENSIDNFPSTYLPPPPPPPSSATIPTCEISDYSYPKTNNEYSNHFPLKKKFEMDPRFRSPPVTMVSTTPRQYEGGNNGIGHCQLMKPIPVRQKKISPADHLMSPQQTVCENDSHKTPISLRLSPIMPLSICSSENSLTPGSSFVTTTNTAEPTKEIEANLFSYNLKKRHFEESYMKLCTNNENKLPVVAPATATDKPLKISSKLSSFTPHYFSNSNSVKVSSFSSSWEFKRPRLLSRAPSTSPR